MEASTQTEAMTISLSPKLARFVKDKVQSGRYTDAAAVIEEALGLLRITPRSVEELREMVDVGIQQLERGEGIRLDGPAELEAFFEDIKARGRERLAAKRNPV